jgi:hypothetical protein
LVCRKHTGLVASAVVCISSYIYRSSSGTYRAKTQLCASPEHANGNLSTVRAHDLVERYLLLVEVLH